MTDAEEIKLLREALDNLMQSADKYIDEGSWLEDLLHDIKQAESALKSTRLNKGEK